MQTGKCKEIYHFDHSMDFFSIYDDTSASKVRLNKMRNLEIGLDEETLERRIHFDKADRLELNVDSEGYKNDVISLEPNVDIERYGRRHIDEASHLELSADNEKCKKVISNSCTGCDIHSDNDAEERRHKDSLCHYDIHLHSDTQETSRQGSPSQYYVDFDEVAAVRRLTESASPYNFELDNEAFDRRPHNSTASIDVHNDAVERTPFNNSTYFVDIDSDTTEGRVNNCSYCTEHDNGTFGRRPLDKSTNCIDISNDKFDRGSVNNTTYCFEHDNETAERRSSDSFKHHDINLENVTATSRHTDSTTSPDNLSHYNNAFEGRPLEREQSDSHIYYELDLDTGAIFEWRDSDGSSHSADDRQELRGPSSRLADHAISHDCLICFEKSTTVSRRKCCKFPVCQSCLETYYATKVSMAIVQVQCIGFGCNKYVSQAEIMSYLTAHLQNRFMQLLVDANRDPRRKTCPRCSHITEIDSQTLREHGNRKYGLRCMCSICNLIWCFKCQAPWHEPLSCQEYQHGDRQFKAWTKQQLEGQANAQKCPKCKVYIQRSGGCDHMTCLRCSTDFCYQCGEKYRKMKFVGDHRSRYSILGCKYRYKPDSPVKRRLVRGSIFGGKLLAAPIVGSLALGAGAVVVGLGLVALPFYGGYKLHKLMKQKRREKEEKAMERNWGKLWDAKVEEDPEMTDMARYDQYLGRARSTSFSFPDYHHFEFDEFDQVLTNFYGDDTDDYNMGIFSLATSANEEPEESAGCKNNQSSVQQSSHEVSSEADTSDVEATGLDADTGALNSDRLNLPADSKVLDGSHDEAEPTGSARTGVRIPRRFCRTYLIESSELGVNKVAGSNQNGKQKNLSSSQDVPKAKDHQVVQTCDEVTHL